MYNAVQRRSTNTRYPSLSHGHWGDRDKKAAIMLKKLLEIAGFPNLIKQVGEIMQTVERQSPTQALASLNNWLPDAAERCNSPLQQLELLNTASPTSTQILAAVHKELMEGEGHLVRTQLLLQHAGPLANWMRDQYRSQLQHALPQLQKSGPPALWAQSTACWLDWTSHAFVLAFFTPPVPAGVDWPKIYALYEPLHHMLERSNNMLGRSDNLRQQVQRSMARLLLLVRSLSTDLGVRQTLIAARLVDLLYPHAVLADRHGQHTPYGTNVQDINPPTLLDGSKPPQDKHKLFFGLEQVLPELLAIENQLLSKGSMPDSIKVADGQTVAETLSVIKHLRNRWSGRPVVRKANRSLANAPVELLTGISEIHRQIAIANGMSNSRRVPARVSASIEDRSATGYGLLLDQVPPWATVGSLLAIFPPEVPRWGVGTIRRVAARPRQRVMIGLQLLATEPLAIRLHEPGHAQWQLVDNLDSLDSHAALYLPASALNGNQAGLLTEGRVLQAGRHYRARLPDGELWLQVEGVAELGVDYVQYSCTRLEGPPA